MPDPPDVLAARLRTAFDLCALGESMRRAQLRREHPDAADEEIEALLVAWLETRPGAEHGDAWGRSISWPPRSGRPMKRAALLLVTDDAPLAALPGP